MSMAATKKAPAASRNPVEDDGGMCSCCEPRNPLVIRPDLGALADGSAEYALCVLHEPDPVVYRNRGDGAYVRMDGLSLNNAGEIVDGNGGVVARVSGNAFQRLGTADDDEPSGGATMERVSQPRTSVHVDLTQDEFYR